MQTTRFEVQRFVSEANAQRHLSASEMQILKEEYLLSKSEFSEVRSYFLEAREKLEVSEKQATAWKNECRLIIVKGHEKEDRFAAELAEMRTGLDYDERNG